MKLKANSPVLFAGFVIVAVVVILIHSSQYFSQSGLLFTTIMVARLLIALSAGVGAYILILICKLIFLPSIPKGTVLNVGGLISATVAILMVVANRGTDISETLLEIYLMRG